MSLKEEEFEIPLDLVEKSPGFSLDIGASTGKLIYRSKKEFKNGKSIYDTDKQKGIVHMATFNQNDIDAVIDVIKERCDVTWKEGDPPIKTTGVGCNLHKAKIEKGLGVKLENTDEFLCLVNAFMALKKSGNEDLFTQLPPQAKVEADQIIGFMRGMRATGAWRSPRMKLMEIPDTYPCETATEIQLPCLMAVCGSVCAIIRVEEDGKYRFLEGQLLAGKFFLGFSTILLGKKPFEELMEEVLAADGKTCDYYMSEIMSKDRQKPGHQGEPETKKETMETKEEQPPKRKDSDSAYSALSKAKGSEAFRVFPMSKVLDLPRDKVKNADAAMSMLQSVCEIIAQTVALSAGVQGLKQIYFIGNFANIPKVRHLITKEMYRRMALGYTEPVNFQFPKLGGHLGSLGAFTM